VAPIGEWLRGPLAGMTSALLLDGRLRDRGIFNHAEITRLWDEHRRQRADHRHRLWQLIMLELWFRQFIDGASAPAHSAAEPAPSAAVAPGHPGAWIPAARAITGAI
jgi:asparagine synthase (glutamine-hydrolysing)